MASQGSDKLRAILAAAREKASSAHLTAAENAGGPPAETHRVDTLLDRNEALPDARALARHYRSNELVQRLSGDEEHLVAPLSNPAPAIPPTPTPATRTPARPDRNRAQPSRPPLSPAQIREVMNELQAQFPSSSYRTFEAKPLPEDVIPMPEDAEPQVAARPRQTDPSFRLLFAVLALAAIGVVLALALNTLLEQHPTGGGATPAPSVSVPR